MNVRCTIAAGLALSLSSRAARADDPSPTASRRAASTAAAVFPGIIVHGSGSFVAGKKSTAKKLAIGGGVGALTAITGIGLVVLTGASRRFVGPLATMTVMGAGIFTTSFLSDFYSVLAPDGGTGEPLLVAPRYETKVGMLGIHDSHYPHRVLVDERVDARFGWFRLSGQGQIAPGSASRRLRGEAAVRLYGPRPDRRRTAGDGSSLDLEFAITDHAYLRNEFGSLLLESSVRGRYDLVNLDRGLRGSFVDGQVGLGVFRDRYTATGASDVVDLWIARFAWGMYVGRGSEASLFYEHRRDGYAGGITPSGIAAGYLGSIGASARMYIWGPFGFGVDLQAGSALLGGVSLLYRSEGS